MSTVDNVTNTATESVAMIFRINQALISRALDGLSEQELWHRQTPMSNPALWIAGHVVQARASVLELFGETFDTGWGDLFRRGAPVGSRNAYPSREEILEVAGRIAVRLRTLLRSLSPEQLAEPARGPEIPGTKTMADMLGFFALHDSYHLGQLAYVRKGLGHPALMG